MSPLSVASTGVDLWGPSTATPDKWNTATWGGTAAWWGDAWNAVDCQVTEAAMTWGADDTTGVTAQSAAGQLLATTYDPDGLLDPANLGGPFAAMLDPGTPIRFTYAGAPLRSGRLATATYDRQAQTGRLEGRDAIAELAAAVTPATFRAVSTGLYAFAAEVIRAAQLSIPVQAAPGGVEVVIAYHERTDSQNVWSLIRDAAFDALHLAYVDPDGVLSFAPFGAPFDRGLWIGDGGICLEELETGTTDEGTYTDLVDGAGPLVTSGLAQPRTLTVERREPAGSAWAAAVMADRTPGGVQYAPTLVRPANATELLALAAIRGMDRVRLRLTTPPALDVNGRVLGAALRAPAGGDWSGAVSMYVPATAWAYVPPTPAAVAGTPVVVSVPATVDAEIDLWYSSAKGGPAASGAGTSTNLTVGGSPVTAVGHVRNRALLRFDLTDDSLWAGVRLVRSAVLQLYAAAINGTVAAILARRVLDPWPEGYADSYLDSNNNGVIWPGPTLSTAEESSAAGPTATGYWSIDVTAIVRRWLRRSLGGDGLPNLGLCILSSNESAIQSVVWRSRETTLGTPPALVINGEG